MSELLHNDKIVIKPADKGGALVIMDKDSYMDEIYSQLAHREVYSRVDTNPLSSIQQCINDRVLSAEKDGIIDGDLKKFLIKENPIIPDYFSLVEEGAKWLF